MTSVLMVVLTDVDLKGPSILDNLNSEASGLRQTMIILGAISLVALGVLLWAIYIRKPRLAKHHGRDSERGMLLTNDEVKSRHSSRSFLGFGKRRKHRKRRARSRNPTLAETGGLPPIRNDDSGETPVS